MGLSMSVELERLTREATEIHKEIREALNRIEQLLARPAQAAEPHNQEVRKNEHEQAEQAEQARADDNGMQQAQAQHGKHKHRKR